MCANSYIRTQYKLLLLLSVRVIQMVQDSVCVVTRDTSSMCVSQDVLFLGLGQIVAPVLQDYL